MHSPFKSILSTNTVPTDAQCDTIRDLLKAPRKELAEITLEIDRLQSLIDEAARKRDELKEFIDPILRWCHPCAGSRKISSGGYSLQRFPLPGIARSAQMRHLSSYVGSADPGEPLLLRRPVYGHPSISSCQPARKCRNSRRG